MSSYLDNRNEKLKILHNIFDIEPSSLVDKLTELPELDRLSKISENRGVELSKFNIFPYKYTKLDHSYGMALILDSFHQPASSIISAMLHEVNTPAFSESVDFLKEQLDIKNYERSSLKSYIVASDTLFEGFFKGDISIDEICNYQKFHLGFASFPRLSACTLEYMLHNLFFTGICNLEEIQEFYYDLTIGKSEFKTEEFCFTDMKLARKFFKASLEIGKIYRSYPSKITLRLISDTLLLMIKKELITFEDLFELSDVEIMQISDKSEDEELKKSWEKIKHLDKVEVKFNKVEDDSYYCLTVKGKPIYIDPLVKTKTGVYRLSHLEKSVSKIIEVFTQTDTDMYMYIEK